MTGNFSKHRHANDMLISKDKKCINRSDCCASTMFVFIVINGKMIMVASKLLFNMIRNKATYKIKINNFNNAETDTCKLFPLF
jgi:hypothetical protein